jgi:hypothetical protein
MCFGPVLEYVACGPRITGPRCCGYYEPESYHSVGWGDAGGDFEKYLGSVVD